MPGTRVPFFRINVSADEIAASDTFHRPENIFASELAIHHRQPPETPAIELLADISVNASLDASVLEAEKRVVLEEMRLTEDNPRLFLSRRLQEAE